MTDEVKLIVGGDFRDDLAAFRSAWERAGRGEHVALERLLAFESWEGLAAVLTPERYRLLRHLHAHPEATVAALARSLGRQFRRVHADVKALEQAGLVDRSEEAVRITADKLVAQIRL